MAKKKFKPNKMSSNADLSGVLEHLIEVISSKDADALGRISSLSFPEGLSELLRHTTVRFGQKPVIEAFARAVHVTPSYLSKVLRGTSEATQELRDRTVEALSLPDDAFATLKPAAGNMDTKTVYVPKTAAKKQKILVFRSGDWGDILLTTPALRGLREKHPDAKITYMCHRFSACILENNPYVDQVLTCANFAPPFPEFDREAPRHHIVHNLQGAVDGEQYVASWNRQEAFCDVMGVQPSDFSTVLAGTRLETQEDLIGLQLEGYTADRSWPYEYSERLARMLVADGFRVALFGQRRVGWDLPRAINKTGEGRLDGSLDLLSQCGVVVSPECYFYHFAAAWDIPFVVLMGSLSPQLQLKHYKHKTLRCVYGIMPCPPCHGMPRCGINPTTEDQYGQAPCMRAIHPERVHEQVLDIIGKTTGGDPGRWGSRGLSESDSAARRVS